MSLKTIALAAAIAFMGGRAVATDRAHPAVVELFQSQGCSSCPPANANLMALADRPDLLTLSFGVTYWDSLGWKDTFASPQYTARQWDYAHALHHTDVFTPQVVVNGSADGVGARHGEIEALVARADRGPGGPQITTQAGKVFVGAAQAVRPAQVLLVRYDPNIVQVPVRRGENGGKTLPHRNVVKELISLGPWTGSARAYALPSARVTGWKSAILIQEGPGGPIVAAARI